MSNSVSPSSTSLDPENKKDETNNPDKHDEDDVGLKIGTYAGQDLHAMFAKLLASHKDFKHSRFDWALQCKGKTK